ncbi:hypothetical protein [Pseudemcibacter aquimaris]|uniref:ATP-binding protein n=1 Tax=Pseudemcibacter aquimaris TaxID=2857064 RepID=UPI002011323F|nr:hypothetical protein [Pseudemcibacter aquimaris]MCC3861327.1 hypothetical protein [Pseudemcibacter aquimaris]WDU58099.1 hypothetical protein KW060_12955 [Pseudemcibacter aquimaris]
MNNKITVTFGPSLKHSSKIVCFEYCADDFGGNFDVSPNYLSKISKILPPYLRAELNFENIQTIHDLLPMIVSALHNIGVPIEHFIKVSDQGGGNYILCCEYNNQRRTVMSIRAAAMTLKVAGLKEGMAAPQAIGQINRMIEYVKKWAAGNVVQGFLMKAKERNIPVRLLVNDSYTYSFGQGKYGRIFNYSASELDSFIGFTLQKSKAITNELLEKTGYPTSEQRIVNSPDMCVAEANKLGFPVVIKPLSEGGGLGVTANIRTIEQLLVAFQEANKCSPQQVLIEKHVEGDVHRITASGGEVLGLARRYPAQVIADGVSNIKTLIEKENIRRKEPELAALKVKQIMHDERLKMNLTNLGYTLDTIPEQGERVILGDIANRSAGGTLEMLNIDDMHPDYIELSEQVSLLFRIDSIGIDVISPDISKSWREVGVIIELNCYPMAAPDLADKFLEKHFGKSEGRIDTTLIVSENDEAARKIFNQKMNEFENPGFASKTTAEFKTGALKVVKNGLGHYCQAFILNKSCDALVVSIRPDEIIANGLPLDYFDRCIIGQGIDIDKKIEALTDHKNLKNWLSQYCGNVEINE